MSITITQLEERHFSELREVADTVARERRFLAMVQAPSLDESFAFYRSVMVAGQCHVAVDQRVVGWCDILPAFGETRRHVGTMGIGLMPEARGRGIGRHLLEAAIETAWTRGLSRIELTVREDNHNARTLYEHLGFEHEGLNRRSMFVDGRYFDCHAMALLRLT